MLAARHDDDDDDVFNGISTFRGYLMPNPSLEKKSSGAMQPLAIRISEFKSLLNRANVIASLEN